MACCDRQRAIGFPREDVSMRDMLIRAIAQAAAATAAAGVDRKLTPKRLNAFIKPMA